MRTTINLDRAAFEAARSALGTEGTTATVNAALREAARQHGLAGFDVRSDIDGAPADVDEGRESRVRD